MTINLAGSVLLVTGANGGLGREWVKQALECVAAKVYASARTPRDWDDPRVVALPLDVTCDDSIQAAARQASDTTIVINNAGVYTHELLSTSSIEDIRAAFDTNFFGAIQVVRAFAPVLAKNGGGAFVDVHSVASWLGGAGAYSATKAAFWSATNSFRLELGPQGIHMLGLHLAYTDTPMVADVDEPKNDPADVVRLAYEGLQAEEYEVLTDQLTIAVKAGLAAKIEDLYPELARA